MASLLSRRRFLQLTSAALAGSQAHAAEGKLDLGFSLYGMKTLPLAEALKACAEIGYQNVELALNAGFPTELPKLTAEARREVREQLAQRHLGLSGLLINLSLAAEDAKHAEGLAAIRAAGEAARDLNADKPPVIETVLGGKPAEWETIKGRMAERLHGWAEAAAAAKATVAIKAHIMSAVDRPEKLLWLLEQVRHPAIAVAYDYSHFELQGIPLGESLRALMPHTRFIHVKDTEGDATKFKFLLPGQGKTDYAAYFGLLRELQYKGPVVVEVSAQVFNQPGYDPVRAAKESYAALAPKL